MKEIICIFYDWCFDFHYIPNENEEELICKQLNIKIIKKYDDFFMLHEDLKIDLKQNKAIVKNIIKKLDTIFYDYTSNL